MHIAHIYQGRVLLNGQQHGTACSFETYEAHKKSLEAARPSPYEARKKSLEAARPSPVRFSEGIAG